MVNNVRKGQKVLENAIKCQKTLGNVKKLKKCEKM